MESGFSVAKDKYIAAVGNRVLKDPEDSHEDEFIKLVPGVYPTLLADGAAKLSDVKFFWLQADNTGGKFDR